MKNHREYNAEPYHWEEVKKLWGNRKLSVEQAIEQLLIWGQIHHEKLFLYERRLEEQERHIADLTAQVTARKEGDLGGNVDR